MTSSNGTIPSWAESSISPGDIEDLKPLKPLLSRSSSLSLNENSRSRQESFPSSQLNTSLPPSLLSTTYYSSLNENYSPTPSTSSKLSKRPLNAISSYEQPTQKPRDRIIPHQVNMMMDMYESKALYKEQMSYVFNNVYTMAWSSVEENPEITDIFGAYIDNYTIGDLSKFVFANMPSSGEFTYCEYDMMNKFKKDLLMASLIDDPLSENADVNYKLLLKKIEVIQESLPISQKKSRRTRSSDGDDVDSESEDSESEYVYGGSAPYTRKSEYNKFVQWNTLFGEFLHDLTEKRIKQEDYQLFKGDTGAEGMITKGWERVIAPPGGDSGMNYDYARAKALYVSQPLNEPKYVEETIRVIQKVNPEFLSDTDYTPLTTMSTSYYNEPLDETSQLGLQTELREFYDNIDNFFKGAVVIPRKKTKGTVADTLTFCYVFYVLNGKTQTDTYKTIDLQMTDMNIDQNAVNARLLYPELIKGDPLSYFYSLFSKTTSQPLSETGQPVELNTDKIDKAAAIISVETPTLETYAKGLDPITRSQSIGLTKVNIQLYKTVNDVEVASEIQKSVITQTTKVMESFSTIITSHISNPEYLTRYVKSINDYFQFNTDTGVYTYDANKTDGNDIFSKLLLESFIGKATIGSMNELLNIWFTSSANITVFKQKLGTNDSTDSYDTIRFEKLLANSMDLQEQQATTFFNFTLGSTTVENVAHTLVQLTGLLNGSPVLNIQAKNISTNQLNELIGSISDTSDTNNRIDPALCSFVVYLLNNLEYLHDDLKELEIVNLVLMFVAFSKSCGDELQRLTCEKINNELGVPVFILTRDRIFVAKCLAETTPCVSTIIIDQLRNPADGDVPIEGGQKGGARENSTQTHGGVLITNISSLKTKSKSPQEIIQEKYIKGLTLYAELNKRIHLKLNDPTPSNTTTLQNILIRISINENVNFEETEDAIKRSITNAFSEDSIDESALPNIKSQIEQLYIQNARLSEFLDILEFYNRNLQSDPQFIQGLIDAEINILALRLLSSAQKQFLLSIGEAKPSNTKGLFKTIQVSAGNADVASTLIEIYTTATTVILDQIQKSREKLLLYHTTEPEMGTEQDTDILYIKLSEPNNLASVNTYYQDIEKAIETQYATFMQQNIKKLELEEIAVNRSGQRSRSSSSASVVSTLDDNILKTIEDSESELQTLVTSLSSENAIIDEDIVGITKVLTDLTSDRPVQDYKIFDDQINAIIQKYDSKKTILSSVTDFFKGTKKKLMDKTSKALKLIEKYATKKRKEVEAQIAKRRSIIENAKARNKQAPPRQTATTLSTIINKAKDSFQRIAQKIYPTTPMKPPMGGPPKKSRTSLPNQGGKRHSKKRNTLFKKGKHSNRRIRKIGVLTRKRHNKQPYTSQLKLETNPHTKPRHKTRRHTRQ